MTFAKVNFDMTAQKWRSGFFCEPNWEKCPSLFSVSLFCDQNRGNEEPQWDWGL